MNVPQIYEIDYALKKARAVLRHIKKGTTSTRMKRRVEAHIQTLIKLKKARKQTDLLTDRARRLNPCL